MQARAERCSASIKVARASGSASMEAGTIRIRPMRIGRGLRIQTIRIARGGGGDGESIDAQCACNVLRRDAVRHQCRDAAIVHALGVDGAELDESIERIVAGVAKVNSIRHASA